MFEYRFDALVLSEVYIVLYKDAAMYFRHGLLGLESNWTERLHEERRDTFYRCPKRMETIQN